MGSCIEKALVANASPLGISWREGPQLPLFHQAEDYTSAEKRGYAASRGLKRINTVKDMGFKLGDTTYPNICVVEGEKQLPSGNLT
jgi:hypothetical protein